MTSITRNKVIRLGKNAFFKIKKKTNLETKIIMKNPFALNSGF